MPPPLSAAPSPGTPPLLPGVDRGAFAAALAARLRNAGVRVSAGGPANLVAALAALKPAGRTRLYWAVRLTLIERADDLAAFDAVFAAVFDSDGTRLDPRVARPLPRLRGPRRASGANDHRTADRETALPWVTYPGGIAATDRGDNPTDPQTALPDALPSRLVGRADEPFNHFNTADLRLLGSWLAAAAPAWPSRSSLRLRVDPRRGRVDLRRTIRASRRTGFEMSTLQHTSPRRRPRRVVLLCDVSRSMRPYVTVYLHLMRAAALRSAVRPEVFAFSTTLTRLTPVLTHRSAEAALRRVNDKLVDRDGGTRLGGSVAELLTSPHGAALRGAVVVIASDGWDGDPPEVLERALARLRRRAAVLVWLNPRAAQPGFRPLAAAMTVALPYCDLFLPGHSLAGLRELFAALTDYSTGARAG